MIYAFWDGEEPGLSDPPNGLKHMPMSCRSTPWCTSTRWLTATVEDSCPRQAMPTCPELNFVNGVMANVTDPEDAGYGLEAINCTIWSFQANTTADKKLPS